MKAQLFIYEEQMEIKLENGIAYRALEGETRGAFKDRIASIVDEDYVDTLDLKLQDVHVIKRKSTAKLAEFMLANPCETEALLIRSVLITRGIIPPTNLDVEGVEDIEEAISKSDLPAKEEKAKKEAKAAAVRKAYAKKKQAEKKVAPKKEETKKAAPKKEAKKETPKKEETKKAAPKKTREPKPKMSLDAVLTLANDARANIKSKIEFWPFRSGIRQEGIIKSVWIDRRVPMAMYKIVLEDGTVKNKLVTSDEIKIIKG